MNPLRLMIAACIGASLLALGASLAMADYTRAIAHFTAALGFTGWLIAESEGT